jgi:hypothetical protein
LPIIGQRADERKRERERERERRGERGRARERAFPSFEAPFFRFSSIFLSFFSRFSPSSGQGEDRREGGGGCLRVIPFDIDAGERVSLRQGVSPVNCRNISATEQRQSRRRREFPVRGELGHVTWRGIRG